MFDITSMLGSTNKDSGNSMSSFDFTGYAAIKNGSYGKLTKAYYSDGTKNVSSEKSSTSKASSKSSKASDDVDTTALTTLKKDANELKTSANALKKDDIKADDVKSFVNNYNKVLDQAGKVSSKEVAQDVKFMKSMTDTFGKVLSKIGVSVGDDGKLSVDEEKFSKADKSLVKSLLNDNYSYGEQIADKASAIAKDTEMSTSIYGNDATVSSALSSVYNQFI